MNANWQKFSKIFSQYISKEKETTADLYILWRLQTLVATGKYEMQGNLAQIKTIEFKQAGAAAQQEEIPQEN